MASLLLLLLPPPSRSPASSSSSLPWLGLDGDQIPPFLWLGAHFIDSRVWTVGSMDAAASDTTSSNGMHTVGRLELGPGNSELLLEVR